MLPVLVVVCLLLCTPVVSSSSAPQQSLVTANNLLRRFFRLRTGCTGDRDTQRDREGQRVNETVVWYHRGSLKSPSTGQVVAGIEGIEFVRPMEIQTLREDNNNNSSNNNNDYNSKNDALSVAYLAEKHFVYVRADNRSQPLTSFRAQPSAPLRCVSPFRRISECVRVRSDAQGRLHCAVHFPGGRRVFSRQIAMHALPEENTLIVGNAVSLQPKGTVGKWIALGGPQEATRARSNEFYQIAEAPTRSLWQRLVVDRLTRRQTDTETHTLSDDSVGLSLSHALTQSVPRHDVRMQFHRYGEGPAWLRPGRAFLLQTDCFRVRSLSDVPEETRRLLLPSDQQLSPPSLSWERFHESKDALRDFDPWHKRLWKALSPPSPQR